MKPGFKEILQFRENAIKVGSKLDFQTSSFLNKLLPKAAQILQVHTVNIFLCAESKGLQHESFGNNERINLISLSLADIIFPHRRSLNRIDETDLEMSGNKELDQVVRVMCRRFKTNDEVAFIKSRKREKQLTEAIIVIRELERLNEYFAFRIKDGSEVVELSDVNANVEQSETLLLVS